MHGSHIELETRGRYGLSNKEGKEQVSGRKGTTIVLSLASMLRRLACPPALRRLITTYITPLHFSGNRRLPAVPASGVHEPWVPSSPRSLFYVESDVSNVIMNILESQVTDLNYLAESPLAISGEMNDQRQSSAESPGVAPNGGMKRKSDESNSSTAPQTRTKRNRYISIAW